ncbi:hypothetical protein HN011_009528 [Eciton burchellii]|nr:hypothetical protein HN011_009528 [Eciton burchellii]
MRKQGTKVLSSSSRIRQQRSCMPNTIPRKEEQLGEFWLEGRHFGIGIKISTPRFLVADGKCRNKKGKKDREGETLQRSIAMPRDSSQAVAATRATCHKRVERESNLNHALRGDSRGKPAIQATNNEESNGGADRRAKRQEGRNISCAFAVGEIEAIDARSRIIEALIALVGEAHR